ncbi:MAG: 5-formyltetrahydrofolate cyclo-ligase [Oscillospiraceae bacterium]|jgi:5-formyltetrahydrofolate cyclo-ligase|nr:5-formyltetrahydrofolate cyclo-ligase [Oscillospiraceae bacterium]
MILKIFNKELLRKNICDSRNNLSKNVKQKMDFDIFNILISSEEYKYCNALFVYVSKPIEVGTYGIISHALEKEKSVAVPKCSAEDLTMSFYKITSFKDLEKGYFQIYEPIKEKCPEVKTFSSGICIVPGFCFDIYGHRLGYGKGYYDKFLENFKGVKIGICYSDYIFEKLPANKHDQKVDILVTEKNARKVAVVQTN